MIPQSVLDEINKLDLEKKDKVLKYIQREQEMGGEPAPEEILEIIKYLKSKVVSRSRSADKERAILDFEILPKDYMRIYNCHTCRYKRGNKCSNQGAPLFEEEIVNELLCVHYAFFGN